MTSLHHRFLVRVHLLFLVVICAGGWMSGGLDRPDPPPSIPVTPTQKEPSEKNQTPLPAAAKPVPRADKWWTEKHKAIVEQAGSANHEVAFIGDSITEQWSASGKAVWDQAIAPLHAVNCGIGGDRTQHVLARLDDGLLDALAAPTNHIRAVVVLIGTNNTSTPADSGADIGAGVKEIVTRLRSRLPDARIILMSILPRGQKPNPQRDVIAAANSEIAPLADDKHVFLVDLGPKFLGKEGEISKDQMPDFLHLSATGYQVWADGIAAHLKKPDKEPEKKTP